MEVKIVIFSVVILGAAFGVHGYPHGAPRKSCRSLKPHHKHVSYNETSAILKLEPEFDKKKINVILETPNGNEFKGFIIQARVGKKVVGKFTEDDDETSYKLMKCHDSKGDTITHRDPDLKNKIEAEWKIPKEYAGHEVDFKAVVVFSYRVAQKLETSIRLSKSR